MANDSIFSVRGFSRALDGSLKETWLRAASAADAIKTARELVPRISGALALCTSISADRHSFSTTVLLSLGDVPDEPEIESSHVSYIAEQRPN